MSKRKDKRHFRDLKRAAWKRAQEQCEQCSAELSKADRHLLKIDVRVERPTLEELLYVCETCFAAERPATACRGNGSVRRPPTSRAQRLWNLGAPEQDRPSRSRVCGRCRQPTRRGCDRFCKACHEKLKAEEVTARRALSKKEAKIDRRWNARTPHRQLTLEEIVSRQRRRTGSESNR